MVTERCGLACPVAVTRQVRKYLAADVVAGLTVGVMAIPQAMSFSLVAGLTAEHGLYSSFLALLPCTCCHPAVVHSRRATALPWTLDPGVTLVITCISCESRFHCRHIATPDHRTDGGDVHHGACVSRDAPFAGTPL